MAKSKGSKKKAAKSKKARARYLAEAGARHVHMLDRLYATIESRRGADPSTSYTAKLMARGREKLAHKLGEEATETIIEAIKGDREKLIAESADLLYHLLALWATLRIEPTAVWDELARREGVSGLVEKAARDDA
jgi:phosphoribosyl-ATP pyrophosphohydrolase